MESEIPQTRLEYLTKRAWIYLPVSFLVFLISTWYGKKSLLFLSYTVIIGFIYSILIVLVWKWETKGNINWLRSSVDTIAFLGGLFILKAWVFPDVHASPSWWWWLVVVQYTSLVLTVSFAFIWLFGVRIRRYLYP